MLQINQSFQKHFVENFKNFEKKNPFEALKQKLFHIESICVSEFSFSN